MKKKETPIAFILVFLFLTASQNILAQQREFFINPNNNTVGAEIFQRADLSQYKYQWEVISRQNDVIIPRSDVTSPQIQIRERFITTRDEFDLINSDEITIRWNGRKPDGELPDSGDGRYSINVYEIAINNPGIEKPYTYPVTIITKEISFRIELDSRAASGMPVLINRSESQHLICNVVSQQGGIEPVLAYSWRVIIKNADDTIILDRIVSRGQDAPFPGFFWNDYSSLDVEIPYTIIVEAADRAGTRFSNNDSFFIVDGEIRSASYIAELMMRMSLNNNEYAQWLIDREQPAPVNVPGYSINEGTDYSWLLSSGYITYIVRPGDYLAKIAREYYGSSYLWGLIYELNKNNFPRRGSANYIIPGMRLRLPPVEVLERLRNSTGQ